MESVYPTIDEAVAARLGEAGALAASLLTLQLKPRLGIASEELRPIGRIGQFLGPVLIMAGTEDKHTPIEEAKRLFAAAKEPQKFWAVPGAAHVDLQRFEPVAYRQKLLDFLAKHLKTTTQLSAEGWEG